MSATSFHRKIQKHFCFFFVVNNRDGCKGFNNMIVDIHNSSTTETAKKSIPPV